MPSTYKVLGQVRPANTLPNDLYTVPAGGQVVVSTIAVANLTANNVVYDIYIRPNGAAANEATAIVFGATIAPNTTQALTLGITADAADIISVDTATANAITFTAFGLEIV